MIYNNEQDPNVTMWENENKINNRNNHRVLSEQEIISITIQMGISTLEIPLCNSTLE